MLLSHHTVPLPRACRPLQPLPLLAPTNRHVCHYRGEEKAADAATQTDAVKVRVGSWAWHHGGDMASVG